MPTAWIEARTESDVASGWIDGRSLMSSAWIEASIDMASGWNDGGSLMKTACIEARTEHQAGMTEDLICLLQNETVYLKNKYMFA